MVNGIFFQFLILGYKLKLLACLLVEQLLLSIPHFRILLLQLKLPDTVLNFQFLILGYLSMLYRDLELGLFQFLILGYIYENGNYVIKRICAFNSSF